MTLLYLKRITCISVLLVVHAALLPQLYSSMSFSTKMDAILHQPQSLPRVEALPPPPAPITIHAYTMMKRPIQDIAVGLGGDKGAGGEVFHSWRQMSHATSAPPPPTQCKHRRTQIQQLWQQTKTICIQQYDRFKVQ